MNRNNALEKFEYWLQSVIQNKFHESRKEIYQAKIKISS